MTYTYAVMELSPVAYAEITAKMKEAGYDHAFDADTGAWDMHGIGIVESKNRPEMHSCNCKYIDAALCVKETGFGVNACHCVCHAQRTTAEAAL